MRWFDNPGKQPARWKDREVMIEYRNGIVSGPHLVSKLRWEPWPFGVSDWDIVRFAGVGHG